MYASDSRSALLMKCTAILIIAGALIFIKAPGRLRFISLIPLAAVIVWTHWFASPFRGIPLDLAIPAQAQKVLQSANPCHIYWDSASGGRLHGHQFFRIQYYFQHCSIEILPSDQYRPPNSLIVQLRSRVDCQTENECYSLHPNVVLYRSPRI